MRVIELARDLGVSSEVLLNLLRMLRISVSDEEAPMSDGDVSRILTRLERERRSGGKDSAEAIEAVMEEAKPTAGRRRRRQYESSRRRKGTGRRCSKSRSRSERRCDEATEDCSSRS